MDPQVREQKPGPCPICKMPMVRVEIAPDKKENEVKLSAEQIWLADLDFSRIAEAARNKLLLWGMAEAQWQELETQDVIKRPEAVQDCTIVYHFSGIL